MGFRMNIKHGDEEYGDDHKLYGYYAFEDVEKSFLYISKFMKAQWEELNYEIYDDPREIYMVIFAPLVVQMI